MFLPCASPSRAPSVTAAAAVRPFHALSLQCHLCHHCHDSKHTAARLCRAMSPVVASLLPPSPGPPGPYAQQSTAAACHQPCTSPSPAMPLQHDWTTAMVRTRGGHRYKPKVRFSTLERDDAGTSRAADAHSPDQAAKTPPTLAPAAIPEEAQASEPPLRRYQTRVGPWAPFPIHPRPRRRARPSKWARTLGPGESSRSRPEPWPPPADQGSSPQLSPASKIRRPMFSCDPISGNVDLCARDFHMESYYDVPTLTADQRFRDSKWFIQ